MYIYVKSRVYHSEARGCLTLIKATIINEDLKTTVR